MFVVHNDTFTTRIDFLTLAEARKHVDEMDNNLSIRILTDYKIAKENYYMRKCLTAKHKCYCQ